MNAESPRSSAAAKPGFAKPAQHPGTPRYFPLKYAMMAAFLGLILPILVAMSYVNYTQSRNDMEKAYHLLEQQTDNGILKAIGLVDGGHKILENFLGETMEKGFQRVLQAYEQAGRAPANMDLEALKKELGGKMDVYVIDDTATVRYTTYAPDLNLNFKKWPDYFKFINELRNGDGFFAEGLKTEARTGNLRMYTFMPSPDHRYLFEFGMIYKEFEHLVGDLDMLAITNRLKTLNPALQSVRIFSRNGSLLGDPHFKADDKTRAMIEARYVEKNNAYEEDREHLIRKHYLFADLRSANTKSDRSKVIELTYDTSLIYESLQRKAISQAALGVVAVILVIFSTFLLAAWITNPIKRIVESVDIIAQGNLDHPISEANVKNELKILKQSIITMVNNMRDFIDRIQNQNQELKELDKLKDDFLSNTSHELRTPINGIIGLADSMLAGACGDLPDKASKNLSMIALSGRRLSNLVNDILDFSKLKHKHLDLQIKPVDVQMVADVVLALSGSLVGRKNIELINQICEHIPVAADENRLQQIFYNLIGNGIKFTEQGSITISAERTGSFLTIHITDTGIGIPEDKQEVIFKSFEQGDGSTARVYGGTGLGLSITKQLIELHGGQIYVKSKVGEGTTMSFTLPLSLEELQPASQLSTTLQASRELQGSGFIDDGEEKTNALLETTSKDGLNILIVDDEPINLQVLENLLTLEKFNVIRANDGFEALQAVESGLPFATILLDLMMPRMSGFEVCRKVREKYTPSDLPIIMLTAKNQVSDLVEGLMAGANDYVTKPFNKNELFARMKTHIQLARITIAYSYFVPHEFLRLLAKESILDVRLGDHVQKHMSVLFTDIRSFTSLSEKMNPKETFDFINEYLGVMGPVIREHRGFIDKYIGDAIMALFPGNADDAVQAAIDMHKKLVEFNRERESRGFFSVQIGIGLHTGNLMLGTIGELQRMEGTVISDAVNLASRLEGLTKRYGARVLVSGQTLDELQHIENYKCRFLDKVKVKGKNEPVKIYEIVDADPLEEQQQKAAMQSTYETATTAYYTRQFDAAAQGFQQVLAKLDHDKTAELYLRRCAEMKTMNLPEDWDGVDTLTEK